MKNFRKNAIGLMAVLLTAPTASAFNSFEKLAQKNMDNYLKNEKKYETKIIEKDQSLNFMVGENVFWITFEGDGEGMLYTLHRRPIRLEEKDITEAELNQRKEKAIHAISEINSKHPYKAVLRGSQVDFEFPVFAASSADYQKVFPAVLKALNTVTLDMFREEMRKVKISNDAGSAGEPTVSNGDVIIVKQTPVVEPQSGPAGKVTLSNPMFRSIDKEGNVLVPYGEVLYQDNLRFIQASVEAASDKADSYVLSMQIINPDGKVFVPSSDVDMTVTKTADLTKKEKALTFTPFGSDNNIIWKPGKYTVVFFVNGAEVLRRNVNIL